MTKSQNIIRKFTQFFCIGMLLSLILLLVIMPTHAMETFLQGVLIWATKVLPALLPFFILTKLLSYTSFTKTVGHVLSPVTKKLYGVGGVSGYIYTMSILSGYPVGAKLTADFFEAGSISGKDARTISAFTSTSGPLFVLGTVGIGLFHCQKIGLIVLISHYIGAILNGLLYRNRKSSTNIQSVSPTVNPISDSMSSSISSIMLVGGFIALFYMILNLLLSIGAFTLPCKLLSLLGVQTDITTAIIAGIIEVTTGATLLSKTILGFKTTCLILSFLISFGGLSIHAQAYCFLKNFKMPYGLFLLQKLTHAILSTLVTFLILLFI